MEGGLTLRLMLMGLIRFMCTRINPWNVLESCCCKRNIIYKFLNVLVPSSFNYSGLVYTTLGPVYTTLGLVYTTLGLVYTTLGLVYTTLGLFCVMECASLW